MSDTRIHSCGEPMTESVLSNQSPVPRHRSQPIWSCWNCNQWEPRDGWQGALPDGWDGEKWTEEG